MRNGARVALALLFAGISSSALAQPAGFPVDKSYKAVSISGFDVQNKGLSMTVARGPGDQMRGSGNAGCNNWNAGVILHDDQIDFTEIATTRKMCAKPVMTAEDAFLTSLRSAKRWHMDGDKLIIEGDAARLMLKPGVAELKADKPAKKRHR